MDQFLQHLVNAAVLGGTYALLGIGLTLIFGIMRVVNFTHGELYAFGAYTVYLIAAALGLNFFFGLVVAVVAGMLLGAMIEIALLRPMRQADIDTVMSRQCRALSVGFALPIGAGVAGPAEPR